MDPIAVDVALLRTIAMSQIKLTPGRVIVARVMENTPAGRGQLSIAGVRLSATLPADVREGQELRLLVKDVSADRVLLSVQGDAAAEQGAPLSATRPHDADVTADGEASGGGPATHMLALRYDAPALGAVDLRFELYAGALRVVAEMGEGAPLASGSAASAALRDAIAQATSLDVTVTVTARRPPLDVYA